jgi:multidrug efflux system outer membrane protein
MMKTVIGTAAALLLSACSVAPVYERPKVALPQSYQAASSALEASAATEGISPWWEALGDAQLNQWVQRALAQSPQTQAAAARVQEADALMRQAGAALFPEVNLSVGGVNSQVTQLGAVPVSPSLPVARTDRFVSLSTSYELDVWGKVRSADQAARAGALSSRYAQATVQTTLAASVVQAWLSLRSLDAQIAITRDSLANRQEALAIVNTRQSGGLASEVEVQAAQPALQALQAQLADLLRQRALSENLLGVLLSSPGLRVATLTTLPAAPQVPEGLPSSLLTARPDVRDAEAQLMAANARIGLARAALFPSLSLTAAAGSQSADLSNLFKPEAFTFSLGLNILAPIFDAGRRDAVMAQVSAQQQQLSANYRQTVLNAFREVRDALSSTEQQAATERALQAQQQSLQASLRLTQVRVNAGFVAPVQLLDAQRNLNDAELALVRARAARLGASVDLFKALGGGWQPRS